MYALQSGTDTGAVTAESLEGREAMLALARHTVAARLFGTELSARHLAFCAELATEAPIRRLHYVRESAALPRTRRAIERDVRHALHPARGPS